MEPGAILTIPSGACFFKCNDTTFAKENKSRVSWHLSLVDEKTLELYVFNWFITASTPVVPKGQDFPVLARYNAKFW